MGKIQKSRQSTFRTIDGSFRKASSDVKRDRSRIDPLFALEEEKQGKDPPVRPEDFMNRKERKAWNRLSDARQEQYISRASREVSRKKISQRGIAKNEGDTEQKISATNYRGPNGNHFRNEQQGKRTVIAHSYIPRRKRKESTHNLPGRTGSVRTTKGYSGQSESTEERYEDHSDSLGSDHISFGRGEVARGENRPGKSFIDRKDFSVGKDQTVSSVSRVGQSAATAGEGMAASTGVGAGAVAAKRTAERFRQQLAQQNQVFENRQREIQNNLQEQRTAGMEQGGVTGTIKAMTATAGIAVVTVVAVVFQMVSGILAMLLAILLPVILITAICGIILSLFAGLGDDYYMTVSGYDIVSVAIGELGTKEEADNKTKYGEFTNTNGLNWCHAFVSWCANECGLIEMEVIPKTALCEDGRQWFIKRDLYQKRSDTYQPQPGDIIYFDFGGEGVSHHAGIVEYSENGYVHTIEGNKRDQVMRGSYPLTKSSIMGYGTPDYPDYGVDDFGGASKFLEKCKEMGQEIVKEKWIYSNSKLKKNYADSKKASPGKTNCAHAISLIMQEYGTLKKGQTFYADHSGKLICGSDVKKRIQQYYDIINVGGKTTANVKDLKAGDICLYTGHVNVYGGTQNGKRIWYDFGRGMTSDHRANSGPFVGFVRKGDFSWAKMTYIFRLKDQDSYGTGKTITLPSGMGDIYTYMGWSMITSRSSRQYQLRVRSGEHYNANGFAKVGDRYAVACTSTYGKIGDEIDFVLKNGRVIHAIMADEKSQHDAGCNKWGHTNGHSVVEFVVNKNSWYHTGKTVDRFHPEWAHTTVVKAVNLGKNYFNTK